ncbi:MAG TPA: hypothetical protein VFE25_03900, partial [Opitutaceae bacterium]|nr:hypothetical protein [Opitutaceae bacterium]
MRRPKKRFSVVGLCLLGFIMAAPRPALAARLGDAKALFEQKKYTEAKALLEPLVVAEPANSSAAYFLGMTYYRQGGPASLDKARQWLGKAVRLA